MSKKLKLAYAGLGALITLVILISIFLYAQWTYDTNPYYEVTNNGMSPTIVKEEIIKVDKDFPFDSILENDIILFYVDDYNGQMVQRVVEIQHEEPRHVRTLGDFPDDSYVLDSPVYEEHYIGKIIKIYSDIESAQSDINGRVP